MTDQTAQPVPPAKKTATERHARLATLAKRWRLTCRRHETKLARAERAGDHELAAEIRGRLKRARQLAARADQKAAKYRSIASLDTMAAGILDRAAARRRSQPKAARNKRQKPIRSERRLTREVTVENPNKEGFDKVQRVVDTIAAMHRRGHLDDSQAQAAGRFRDAYDLVEGGITGTLDPSRGMGGGMVGNSLSTEKLWAANTIAEVSRLLGKDDIDLLRFIAGEGHTITDAAKRYYGKTTNRSCDFVGDRLKRSLKTLAQFWHMFVRRKSSSVFRPDDAIPRGGSAQEFAPSRVAHVSKTDVKFSGEGS